jgi:hypothetical protein
MPVAPPDPGRALRAAPVAAVHSPERNAASPAWPPGALATRPGAGVAVRTHAAPGPDGGRRTHVLSRHAP